MFARLMGLEVISPAELRNLMQNESVTVIDVNSRQNWLRARVPGAVSLDPVAYSETDLPPHRDSILVFYCSNFMCRKAPNAARAEAMGYRNVRVMSAGISGWLGASLPTEAGETQHA